MRKRWILAGVILAIAVTGLMAIWPESVAQKEAKNMKNLETEVVRVELAGHRFDIPMRYMYGQAIEKHGQWPEAKKERVKVDALTLSVLLPDMCPYYPEDDAKWNIQGHGDRLEVSITQPVGGGDWYGFIRRRINDEVSKGVTTEESSIYGLVHYLTPLGPRYFPIDESNELTISCVGSHRPEPGFSYSCKTKSSYLPGVVLEYYYGFNYLPNWYEIDSDLKTMLNKLIQAAKSE